MSKQSSLLNFVVRGVTSRNEQEKELSTNSPSEVTLQPDIEMVSETSPAALAPTAKPATLPCQGTLAANHKSLSRLSEHNEHKDES